MIQITNKKNCSGCYACYSVCPKKCISMNEDNEGYRYPVIDKSKCIDCDLCEKKCPTLNKDTKQKKELIGVYACYSKKDEIRNQSSSGGIFTSLSNYVLDNNGAVFGATYDKDFNVVHEFIEDNDEISKFRGAKYLQSVIGENFKVAKKFLDDGKLVLFSGTPCQIDGLIEFLGRQYSNLICVDIVCHGVPSKKIWNLYRNSINNNKSITSVNFRDKNKSWQEYNLKIKYSDGSEFNQLAKDNLYMQGFVNDFYLRPSCYDCKSKGINRRSDITLGDFWGIDNVIPGLNDQKGISAVIIQSNKGKEIFEKITDDVKVYEVDIQSVVKYNKSIVESPTKSDKRDRFFYYVDKFKFDQAIELSMTYSRINNLKKCIKFKISNIVK